MWPSADVRASTPNTRHHLSDDHLWNWEWVKHNGSLMRAVILALSRSNERKEETYRNIPSSSDLLLRSYLFQKISHWQITWRRAQRERAAVVRLCSVLHGWQPRCAAFSKEERKQETSRPLSHVCWARPDYVTQVFFSSKVREKVVKSPLTASRNKNILEKYPTAPVSVSSYWTLRKPLYQALTWRIPAAPRATHTGNMEKHWWQ